MATIKFLLQSKINPTNIYLRLSIDRTTVLRRKSGYLINPNDWSSKTNQPKQGDETLKELKNNLGKLATAIETNLNKATANKEEITGNWLQEQIDAYHGKKKKTDLDRLTNYIQYYIDNLPYKVFSGGKTGVVHNTIQKYTTLKNKIVEFEKYKKKRFYIKDVGLKFGKELTKYFLEVDKLSTNSTGRYVKYLKSVCNDAKENGIETHPQLKSIRGITAKSSKIYLTFEELEKIENKTYSRAALENAKNWLIIGCYIGQLVSDLLCLTSKNINIRNEQQFLEYIGKTTNDYATQIAEYWDKEYLKTNEKTSMAVLKKAN